MYDEVVFCNAFIFSDLCKKQVVDELQESKISEFRSGILTRCQQTFENKCQSEIDKKKKEAEEEQDVYFSFFMTQSFSLLLLPTLQKFWVVICFTY